MNEPIADVASVKTRVVPIERPHSMLPQIAIKVLTVVVGLAALVLGLPAAGIPMPPAVTAICAAVVALGAAIGIASPGLTKAPAAPNTPAPVKELK